MRVNTLHTDVLVVGAGPTGLMAANQLQRFGVEHLVIDTKSGPTDESRAIAITARSLEIYQQMGLSDIALQQGKKMIAFGAYLGGKQMARVNIGEFGKGQSDFSYLLAFEQSRNETLLTQNLERNGGKVLWNYEFIELTDYRDQISARIKNSDGELTIHAKYLIGCEGANSPVRNQLDFNFEGGTYDHRFFVADTVMDWKLPYDEIGVFPGDDNFCAFFSLRGEKCMRVIGTLPLEYTTREDVGFDDIKNLLIETTGVSIEFRKVNWFSTYLLHHRAVDHFRQGRIFLAGDSAHIHSPAGGQGMNTGLQDAYNLAWKLAMVLKHGASEMLLDTYNEERLPFAKWLLNFTDRGFRVMTSRSSLARFFRKHVAIRMAGLVTRMARVKITAFRTISQIAYSYGGRSLSRSNSSQKLKFQAGDRLPYLAGASIYGKFTAPAFHLLHLGEEAMRPEQRDALKNSIPFPIRFVEEARSEIWAELGVTNDLFVLVRPDNYIATISDAIDENFYQSYFRDITN